MPPDESSQPFFLIVTDHDRGVFAVEGPMTDDRPWNEAASYARNHQGYTNALSSRLPAGRSIHDRHCSYATDRGALRRVRLVEHATLAAAVAD